MSTFETILLILLVVDAIALCALVLLQQGKGADIGAAFGSGAANAMFGGAGSASFLAKLTAWLALAFFLLSLGLAFTAKERAAELANVGIPTVVAPTTAPTAPSDGGSTAPQPDATTPETPADSAQPPQNPDTKLTAPSEPVDSGVPNV